MAYIDGIARAQIRKTDNENVNIAMGRAIYAMRLPRTRLFAYFEIPC